MNGDFQLGDRITQYGNRNTGVIHNAGPADPRTAFREMVAAIQTLRSQVSPADQRVLDGVLAAIGTAEAPRTQHLRQALSVVAGVAGMVGQLGVPVIASIRKVLAAFGV